MSLILIIVLIGLDKALLFIYFYFFFDETIDIFLVSPQQQHTV